MWPLTSVILACIISIALPAESYRILGVFPFHAKSHFVMFERLMKGLAERGHQVDVVSHFPLKKPLPNYNDIINLAGILPDLSNKMTLEYIEDVVHGAPIVFQVVSVYGIEACELMSQPKFQNLMKNPPTNPAYDLVITEIFGSNCYLAMGQHLKIPVVGLDSSVMFPWANDHVANPDNPAYIANMFSEFGSRMNFWERLQNTLINWKVKWDYYRIIETQNAAIKKYIGPNAPTVREAEKNVSLILVNSHHSLNGVRPFTTAVVEVGGLHIDEREATLPKELQEWLDDSKDGFVYVSFGSLVKLESFPKETLVTLYDCFAKLAPVRVLMKIANPEELTSGLPSNVLTQSWIPQLAVLKHSNIRAFMTHGGLMGTQEAIYYGVPMIGVPIFGDQPQNIKLYSKLNLAVALDYKKLTEQNLNDAFRTVLHDPSYTKAAKRISALFRDRPMSALDTAVFWVEYVIKHGGENLRSPAMDLTWWQIALCDVYGFLFISAVLVTCLIIAAVKKIREIFQSSGKKPTTKSKKVK